MQVTGLFVHLTNIYPVSATQQAFCEALGKMEDMVFAIPLPCLRLGTKRGMLLQYCTLTGE
jgi:hypothetical protein